ncbi:MAG: hypothetical protein DYG89_37275 [Caldilinea sp. CFX5]|nr:hypothetical protein [Caldilinea sp. CFX5]
MTIMLLALFVGALLAPATYWTRLFSAADSPIYTDALAAGWQDWSWDTTRNAANTQPVHSGTKSYAVDHTAAWGGFYLRAEPAINTAGFTHLRFWLHGGATGGQQIRILLNEDDTKIKLVTATANAWTQVDLPLADLGSPATINAIYWQDVNGGAQAVYYLDDISLVGATQPPPAGITIQVDDTAAGTTIDPRILGTNMAAWSKPLLTNATFIARTKASGVSVIRIPGGSWSNGYGWLSCEMGEHVAKAEKCRAPDRQGGYFDIFWAATPTDWIDFLQAVGIEGMYIVNPNGTPQEAAAAVAFFNAAVNDATVIGVDARGKDWLTAGHWAQLRADRGNPTPLGIKLWAVGNEVYAGTQCVQNGWEPMWTCEGTEYVNGATVNNVQQGGYLAFRTAMRAVDPTILVGAVGDSPGTSYGNWGNEVVSAAAAVMDFYDVHAYAYWDIPANNQILSHPQSFWPGLMTGVRQTFAQHANGRTIPVALTEYNLGLEFKDTNIQMTRAVNGLFMADSVGQLITSGYTMANQFLLASGDQPETGTDFGLLRPDHNWQRSPQYFAYHLWAKFGDRLLPVTSSANAATELSVYAGRRDANTLTLLVVNKRNAATTATIDLKSGATMQGGKADVAQATALEVQTMSFNGIAETTLTNDLSNAPGATLSINGTAFDYTFAPYSVTLLQLQVATGAPTATPTPTPITPGPTPTPTATPIPAPGEPAPGSDNCYLPVVRK